MSLFNLIVACASVVFLIVIYLRTPLKLKKYRLLFVFLTLSLVINIWLLLCIDWKWADFILIFVIPFLAEIPFFLEKEKKGTNSGET